MSEIPTLAGYETMRAIVDALGLRDRHINRLVIVCDVDELVTVYVKEYIDEQQGERVAQAVAAGNIAIVSVSDVTVDENGNVFVEELPNVQA